MMRPSEQLESRHQPAEIWTVISCGGACAMCDEQLRPGESVVEGVDGELIHLVCCFFSGDEDVN